MNAQPKEQKWQISRKELLSKHEQLKPENTTELIKKLLAAAYITVEYLPYFHESRPWLSQR